MIGIYKITSPTFKIYIGQSIDIERRWIEHKRSKTNSRLNSSFKSHGIESHIFEILEECRIEDLNERERFYQDFYDTLGPNGLNLRLTESSDKSGCVSQETRDKLVEYHKNKDGDLELIRRQKISESVKQAITPELKQHWSKIRKNKPVLQEQRDKISKTANLKTAEQKAEITKRRLITFNSVSPQEKAERSRRRSESRRNETLEQIKNREDKRQETLRVNKEIKAKNREL